MKFRLSTAFVLLLLPIGVDAQVRVKGYLKRDGTYVMPHLRSRPNSSFWDNWSTKGNSNPYTGEYGTKLWPSPSFSSYRNSSRFSQPFESTRSRITFDDDPYWEIIRLQNELRIARMREEASREYEDYMRRMRNQREADEAFDRIRAEQRIEEARQSMKDNQEALDQLLQVSKSSSPSAPVKKKEHVFYIVKSNVRIYFDKPVPLSETQHALEDVFNHVYPDHFRQYQIHQRASERALDQFDYAGFKRAVVRARNIIEGREWAYIKPSIKFKLINDARTLLTKENGFSERFGRVRKDALVRTAPRLGAVSGVRVYEGEPLLVTKGPSKAWLCVLLANRSLGYIRTSECEVSSYGIRIK